MADRADNLLATLPPDVRDDAQHIYDEIGRTKVEGGPDPRDVVAELYRRGLLDDGQLREAVLALEATLKVRRSGDAPPKNAGHPKVIGRLGAGAMGEVLLAKDPGLNRIVAVKRLHPAGAKRRTMLRRFYTEAQVTAQLDHPSIVPIHSLIQTDDGGLAYSMKLVRGKTMEDYLQEARAQHGKGKVQAQHALPARLERFLDVCDALAYAHERGVLHRDLKPENIMVGAFGEVVVMDWGIAKLLDKPEVDEPEEVDDEDYGTMGGPTGPKPPSRTTETRVGTVMGTPRYMAPEQALGRTDLLDPRSDQYALGLILFEVVSLGPAIRPDLSLEQAVAWAESGKKLPLKHAFGEKIPPELAGIIDKATQVKPERRYKSVADMADDIRRYLRDEPVLARPDTLRQRIQRLVARRRQAVLNLLFLLTLGIVITGALGAFALVGTAWALNWQSQIREEQITAANRVVNQRAKEIETELYRMESLLHGLTFAAAQALDSPPPELPYAPSTAEPPGRQRATLYDKPITADWPSVSFPEGTTPDPRTLHALVGLGPRMSRLLADSAPRGTQARDRHQLLGEVGAPVVWARIVTADGLSLASPGMGPPQTAGPDLRQQPWFTAARGRNTPVWTGPRVDEDGMGLVYTVSMAILDSSGRTQGVAALDVTLAHLAKLVLPPEVVEGAWLIDDQGRVVVHDRLDARRIHRYQPTPFPRTPVRDTIQQGPRQGWTDTHDGRIAVWSRLPTLDLTYVLVGYADELVASEGTSR